MLIFDNFEKEKKKMMVLYTYMRNHMEVSLNIVL